MIGAMLPNDTSKFFSALRLDAAVLKYKVYLFEFDTSLQHGKFFKTLHTYKDKTLLFCVIVTQIKKRKVILLYSPVHCVRFCTKILKKWCQNHDRI